MFPCPPQIAVIAAGEMGSAIGSVLANSGCTVFTNLEGRSDATRKRAHDARMKDVSLAEIGHRADWVLSILPPNQAIAFASRFIAEAGKDAKDGLVFVDCNAVSPQSAKRIAELFAKIPSVRFIDAAIIGGPPSEGLNPTIYACADGGRGEVLDSFVGLSSYGLKVSPLNGDGAGVGDASALKMSYSGITKGTTGLLTMMILAAHASSPSTADALLHELHVSQPMFLERIVKAVPPMLPKAYRWASEMEEISEFVGGNEGATYMGLASLYESVEQGTDISSLFEKARILT